MTSSWKALGRTLEIITIVLLVLAVAYLWVDSDSEDIEAPQVTSQAPDAKTETIEPPYQPPVPPSARPRTYQPPVSPSAPPRTYQPPVPTSADIGTYHQPTVSSPSIYLSQRLVRPVPYSSCSSSPALIRFSSTTADSPNSVIEDAARLLDEAIEERRDELAEDKEALYALIDEILLPRFDRRYSAQLILARHWRSASEEQRERFINAFYCHLMQRYAEAVLAFDLARLEVLPFRGDATKRRTTVKTTMRLDDGTKVPVNYGMVSREMGWKMFDVTIEGISYVRTFKAELNAEIRAEGLSAVIERLEDDTRDDAAK